MLVLDTQSFVWWVGGSRRLRTRARERIATASDLVISAMTVMEMGYLVHRGRLTLSMDYQPWLRTALSETDVRVVPVDVAIATEAGALEWDHGDPADRAIIATARKLKAPLVTSDERIHACGLVEVVW